MTAFAQRDFSGIATVTQLAGDITNTDTTFIVSDSTGWPAGGSTGDFFVQIEDEIILCASRTGNAVTVSTSGRGYDDTVAVSHTAGVPVKHVISKTDYYEANKAVANTVGLIANAEDMLVGDSPNTLKKVGKGSNGQVWQVIGGVLGWGDLPADSVGSDQLQVDSVSSDEIAANAVGVAELSSAVAGDGLAGGSGAALAVTAGTGLEVSGDAVRIAATAAGNGLTGGAGSALAVNVDGTTLEISSDALQVKALGVGSGQLGAGAVSALSKFASTLRPITLATSAPGSPTAGDFWWDTDSYGLYEYTTATTGWQAPWNMPWGCIAYADNSGSSDQTITSGNTDLTGLTTGSIDIVKNRRYRVRAWFAILDDSGGTDTFSIVNASNTVLRSTDHSYGTNFSRETIIEYIFTASSTTTITFKVRCTTVVGTIHVQAGNSNFGHIMVEDIGPNGNPA